MGILLRRKFKSGCKLSKFKVRTFKRMPAGEWD